jgi:hypothetical protein
MQLLQTLSRDDRQVAGKEILKFHHRLDETGLFTDEALAQLIDEHPRDQLTVCTMRPNPPPHETWVAGDPGNLSGAKLVEAARKGSLWVSPRSAMTKNPRYKLVFDKLMAEFSKATGIPHISADAAVLISSPNMGIFFHVDPAETMLWHVRGHKTIFVYPPHEDHVTEAAMEAILLKETLSDLPYNPLMENEVTPVMLKPGEGAYWPLHSPHRVSNGDDLNVSVSIEFSSPRSVLTNGVFYTNGRLRRRFGWAPKSRGPAQAVSAPYLLAAKALKTYAPPLMNFERSHERRFDVKLSAPGCIAWRKGLEPDWVEKPARRRKAA